MAETLPPSNCTEIFVLETARCLERVALAPAGFACDPLAATSHLISNSSRKTQ
jgi:hypothetical protein